MKSSSPKSAAPLLDAMSRLDEVGRIRMLLESGAAAAGGLWGASAGLLVSAVANRSSAPVLVVAPGPDEADLLADDIHEFAGRRVMPFPAWDVLPTESETPETEPTSARIEVARRLERIASGQDSPDGTPIIATSLAALLQPLPTPGAVSAGETDIAAGVDFPRDAFIERLEASGYEHVPSVEVRGEYAVRGGIVDVYPWVSGELTDEGTFESVPYRIEFFGDRIESIRTFDPATQRTVADMGEMTLEEVGASEVLRAFESDERSTLIDHLPPGSIVVLSEPEECQSRAVRYYASYSNPQGLYDWGELWTAISGARRLEMRSLAGESGSGVKEVDFGARSTARVSAEGGAVEEVINGIAHLTKSCDKITLFCDNASERSRMATLLADGGLAEDAVELVTGRISAGFEMPLLSEAALSDHEIFGRYRHRRRVKKRVDTRPISQVLELEAGDLVVHSSHGIARYLHMKALKRGDREEDYLTLQFQDDVRLYVPASHIHLVHKYVGTKGTSPRLSRLGGKAWVKRRAKVARAVRDIAEELLATQAKRKAVPGIPYPPDGEWQGAFEAAFIYEETDDQLAAAEAIKADMISPYPMDRLLCGDVGFGKTEVAIRAAFRAVNAGRQVAMLVPTTVLAEQHYATFRERLADYPVVVEGLSRFKTKGEQKEIVERMKSGGVDVAIGTHRIIQKDIEFKDLGLVIVDEEQRFGVENKEFFKTLRANVDMLTLTATPIPRTLHMALVGIRDISSLSVPPEDRLSIRTKVCRRDNELIRRGILREINREGQVFFIHNRVGTIQKVASELGQLVPEASIIYAHGQMADGELAARMSRFISGEADVLVATTIIENGIDIPRANTIFMDRADMFGLSELHQLRGRVGRYKHRAYAYLMVDPSRKMTREGVRRLKAIEEFDELGAGFRLAMRDMEIRGAGNVLGAEQSGHIAEIGYELYCRLLESTVGQLQGQAPREDIEVQIALGEDAFVPPTYITEERLRLELYRGIDSATCSADIDAMGDEITDRYGAPPPPVERLLAEGRLRVHCRRARVPYLGIKSPPTGVAEPDRLGIRLHGWDLRAARDRLAATLGDVRVLDGFNITSPLEGSSYAERLEHCESVLKKLESLLESSPELRRIPGR